MKKLFFMTVFLLGVTAFVNAMKVTVCLSVGPLSVCKDFDIGCSRTSSGGVECHINPARAIRLDGKIDKERNTITIRLPRTSGWNKVETITLDKDVYLKDSEGKESNVKIKAGVYYVKNGIVKFSSSIDK